LDFVWHFSSLQAIAKIMKNTPWFNDLTAISNSSAIPSLFAWRQANKYF
jgi:hypothetical protein